MKEIKKLAQRGGNLIRKQQELEAMLPKVRDEILTFEKARFSHEKFDEKAYRRARESRSDIEAQLEALPQIIDDIRQEGNREVSRYISERKTLLAEQIEKLKADRGIAITKDLLPLLADYIIAREKILGLPLSGEDVTYLWGATAVRSTETRDLLTHIVVKARPKAANDQTLSGQWKAATIELSDLNQGNFQGFDERLEDVVGP
jgi:hypothetical protein